jgi:hypothetical protein
MAEIVNLNKARKAKLKDQAQTTAAENRVKHGRTKAEKAAAKAEAERAARALEQTRREP